MQPKNAEKGSNRQVLSPSLNPYVPTAINGDETMEHPNTNTTATNTTLLDSNAAVKLALAKQEVREAVEAIESYIDEALGWEVDPDNDLDVLLAKAIRYAGDRAKKEVSHIELLEEISTYGLGLLDARFKSLKHIRIHESEIGREADDRKQALIQTNQHLAAQLKTIRSFLEAYPGSEAIAECEALEALLRSVAFDAWAETWLAPDGSEIKPNQILRSWRKLTGSIRISAKLFTEQVCPAIEERPVHPVQRYLQTTASKAYSELGQHPRWNDLATWLFGIPQDDPNWDLYNAMTQCFLLSMVRRALYPGCSQKRGLVLYGEQNARKSDLVASLLPNRNWLHELKQTEWSDEIEILKKAGKTWLMELPEAGQFLGTRSANTTKSLQSMRSGMVRKLYTNEQERIDLSVNFIYTTNEPELFVDSANTRFWVIPIPSGFVAPIEELTASLDQLWGTAYALYEHWQPNSDLPPALANRSEMLNNSLYRKPVKEADRVEAALEELYESNSLPNLSPNAVPEDEQAKAFAFSLADLLKASGATNANSVKAYLKQQGYVYDSKPHRYAGLRNPVRRWHKAGFDHSRCINLELHNGHWSAIAAVEATRND